MKVQLVVVRGKPEGKVIPLVGPNFKIGRGETCHLRPNSEQVSREHAEFTIEADSVMVRDLGSRNGTLVNGKALTAEHRLKDRDLVQVGPLTFAVSISEVAAPKAAVVAATAAAPAVVKKASPDDVSGDEIDSWLLGEGAAAAENPTVYGGDTITITAFKDAKAAPAAAPAPAAKPQPPPSASDDEYERQAEEPVNEAAETVEALEPQGEAEAEAEGEAEAEDFSGDFEEEQDEDEEEGDEDEEAAPEEEFIDESNPFFAAKKAQKEQAKQTGPAKPAFQDSSDAANDILRRLIERRRANKG